MLFLQDYFLGKKKPIFPASHAPGNRGLAPWWQWSHGVSGGVLTWYLRKVKLLSQALPPPLQVWYCMRCLWGKYFIAGTWPNPKQLPRWQSTSERFLGRKSWCVILKVFQISYSAHKCERQPLGSTVMTGRKQRGGPVGSKCSQVHFVWDNPNLIMIAS